MKSPKEIEIKAPKYYFKIPETLQDYIDYHSDYLKAKKSLSYNNIELQKIDTLKRMRLRYNMSIKDVVLSNLDLSFSMINNCIISSSDFSNTSFFKADLSFTDFIGVDFTNVNFSEAILTGTKFINCKFDGANFNNAHIITGASDSLGITTIDGSDISNAKYPPDIPMIVPPEGESFIGYKKVYNVPENLLNYIEILDGTDREKLTCIAKLEIPKDAKRLSSSGRKCRCDRALVLEIYSIYEDKLIPTAISKYDSSFVYKAGEMVHVDNFDENRWNECSTGIHFFMTRNEAFNY